MAICHNKQYEREFVHRMIAEGHHCERVAGSGSGEHSVCDCVLFKEGEVYLVEVKATKGDKLYMRAPIKKQLEKLRETAQRVGVKAMLAVKIKYKGWELQVI